MEKLLFCAVLFIFREIDQTQFRMMRLVNFGNV